MKNIIVLILFALSPIILTFSYSSETGESFREIFNTTHWFLIFTVPISGIIGFIFIIKNINQKRKLSLEKDDNDFFDGKNIEKTNKKVNRKNLLIGIIIIAIFLLPGIYMNYSYFINLFKEEPKISCGNQFIISSKIKNKVKLGINKSKLKVVSGDLKTDGKFLYYDGKKIDGDYEDYIDFDSLEFGTYHVTVNGKEKVANFGFGYNSNIIKDKNYIYSVIRKERNKIYIYIEKGIDRSTFKMYSLEGPFKDKNHIYVLKKHRLKIFNKIKPEKLTSVYDHIWGDGQRIYYYAIHSNRYRKTSQTTFYEINGVDYETFKYYKNSFFKDKNNIYLHGKYFLKKILKNKKDFEIIDNYIIKNKDNVFLVDRERTRIITITGIESKNFKKVGNFTYSDGKNTYKYSNKLKKLILDF